MTSPWCVLPVHYALKEFIQSIVYVNFNLKSTDNLAYTFPWSSSIHLCFTLNEIPIYKLEPKQNGFVPIPLSVLVGPKLINDTIDMGHCRHVMCIVFKPGGFKRLSGLPAPDILNKEFDASLIWNKEIRIIEEKIRATKSIDNIKNIIESWLLAKASAANNKTPFDHCVNHIVARNGNITIAQVAEQARLSVRQFERKSLEHLGISPKLFARLTRFTNAYVAKENSPGVNWGSLAYEYGYADQMHLINDFKLFSGQPPSVLEKSIPHSVNITLALGKY